MTSITPKFANATLRMSKTFYRPNVIIARSVKALKRNGATAGDIEAFVLEATKGDFKHLLDTCRRWLTVLDE